MNDILLSNQVIVFLLGEFILFVLLFVAFIVSLKVVLKWNFQSFTPQQFSLEKQLYLVTTIIIFVFGIKFFLLLYFIFTTDAISIFIPGAMCAAGVITANIYGNYLLAIKFFIIFALILWLNIHLHDIKTKDYKWFKEKSYIFIAIFIAISIEIVFDYLYFVNIDTHLPVSCCSALFGQLEGANPLPFNLNIYMLLILFYLLFILTILSLHSKYKLLFILSSTLFIYISYYSVVYFFGTYIYELPTHKCPFCMLQSSYGFVGYILWGSLFIGSFIGISNAISSLWIGTYHKKSSLYVTYLLSLFVMICSGYVVIYYLTNGIFL